MATPRRRRAGGTASTDVPFRRKAIAWFFIALLLLSVLVGLSTLLVR
ncbi:MAG: hypothetical protein ACT4PT_03510 [Methanobacteriota archaeon]